MLLQILSDQGPKFTSKLKIVLSALRDRQHWIQALLTIYQWNVWKISPHCQLDAWKGGCWKSETGICMCHMGCLLTEWQDTPSRASLRICYVRLRSLSTSRYHYGSARSRLATGKFALFRSRISKVTLAYIWNSARRAQVGQGPTVLLYAMKGLEPIIAEII